MNRVLVLDRRQTELALDPIRLLEAVRDALIAVGRGEVSAPPRVAADTGTGLLGAMPGHVPGVGLAAKLVSVFPASGTGSGRSIHRGVVMLFDEHNGRPLALVDAAPVTALRTAATATLSMSTLARPGPRRIAIVGTGVQARAQLAMLAAIGEPGPVVVAGRSSGRAERVAALHASGSTAASIEAAVATADVVFCCTDAAEPVLRRRWLRPGTHVSSIGGSRGPELDAATIADARVFVEWAGAVTCPPPAGAHELQGVDPRHVRLLGPLLDARVRNAASIRPAGAELTVFKSTGHAALDVAAASVAYRRARELGLGTPIDL